MFVILTLINHLEYTHEHVTRYVYFMQVKFYNINVYNKQINQFLSKL